MASNRIEDALGDTEICPASAASGPARHGHESSHRALSHTPVAERVADNVLAMIARGEFIPGQRLPGERQLAESMAVSRVSVRAALQKLKAQGLLEAVQGGGTRVVASTGIMDPALSEMVKANLENFHDLAEIRVILEAWAARRAADHASDADIAEIGRLVDAMAEANSDTRGQRDKAADDVAFHMAIARAAGSPVYIHMLSTIRETLARMLEFHRYELFWPNDDLVILNHHEAIHRAIAARDGDAAETAMRVHLTWVLDHYRQARGGR